MTSLYTQLPLDSQLSMDVHVAAVCRSCYYQLRQLRPLTRSLSTAAAETVVHAFIASRLDYCNALLYGVSDRLMCRLQSVQNAAARLVTGARRCDHITPILRQLHWLPLRQPVQDRCPCLSMSSRPSTVVLVRRLPACLRLPTAPSPVIRFTVVCRSTCTQHVW